jgi:hypothetical protein
MWKEFKENYYQFAITDGELETVIIEIILYQGWWEWKTIANNLGRATNLERAKEDSFKQLIVQSNRAFP